MLRWLVLLVTLVVWLLCIRLVYQNYGPQEAHEPVTADRKALDNLFGDSVEMHASWDIYIRPSDLNDSSKLPFAGLSGAASTTPPPAKPEKRVPWSGYDEAGLSHVGRLDVNLKTKFTLAEMKSELHVDLPDEIRISPELRQMRLTGWSAYNLDDGLKDCSAKLVVGDMLEASAFGTRSGDTLLVTKDVSFGKKQLFHQQDRLPIGPRSAPNVEVLLFQRNKDVNLGVSWNIAVADLSSLDVGAIEPKMTQVKVTCISKTQIRISGTTATVFEVRSEDGSARAWYSADGMVLKQTFPFLNMFDVYFVRATERHNRRSHHEKEKPEQQQDD